MSKTVDERVVSMQFDNRHFETNVKTSMSTLDKLKQKLDLKGATKGLENVDSAAKKVNLSGLGGAVESVGAKFSSLQVMAVTALANITNSAVNAGKQMLASLTIQPVTTGFKEYELKMGSIQTIMAGTGESLETVNRYLNELNEYSDKTIYSFSDMTQNIGKFTNAGVKLEDAVLAIKGISNEAAVSGANANEASRAMYNFAQALSAGYVKLIDWKSIENANMATVEFKQQLIDSAVAAGTLKKAADGMYTTLEGKTISATKNFNDSLQDQWMTTEVLVKTLKNYADEETAIGKKAYAAAQDVKTFSMMMDTLRESAQSGWAQTWELIVGDYDQAKNIFTRLSKFFGNIIEKTAAARNAIVKGALSSSWDRLTEKINKAGISTESFTKSLSETAKKHGIDLDKMIKKEGSLSKVIEKGLISKDLLIETIKGYAEGLSGSSKQQEDLTKKLKYFQKVVDQVWHGDYKNGKARIEALTKAGYDYSKVQDLVNKTVDGHRLTLADLNETQLKNVGYTDEQIAAIKKLAKEAEEAGTPLNELINSLEKPSGRELLIETGKNLYKAISVPLTAIKEAWQNTFTKDGETVLYNIIEKLHSLSENLIMSKENAENFKKVFEGLFAGFQIANMAIGGGLMAVLKIAGAVLDLFGTNLLEVGGNIADYIIKFRDWVEEHTIFVNSYGKIAKIIKAVIDGISRCVKAFIALEPVQKLISRVTGLIGKLFGALSIDSKSINFDTIVEAITAAFDKLEAWIKGLNDSENIGLDILKGIGKGLLKGIQLVVNGIKAVANMIIDTFCDLFGIHSPSKLFMIFGGFIIAGLIVGLKDGFGPVMDTLHGLCSNIFGFIKNLNIGAVLSSAFGVGLLLVMNRILDIAEAFASLPKGIGSFLKDLGQSKLITAKANAMEKKSKAILNFALAIGILAVSLTLLSRIEWDKLWKAGLILLGLMAALLGVAAVMSKLSKTADLKQSAGMLSLGTTLVSMAGAILLLSVAMKMMSGIKDEDVGKTIGLISVIFVGFAGLMAFAKVAGEAAKGAGKMIFKIAGALLIITLVLKILGGMNQETAIQGLAIMSAIGALFVGFIAISKLSGEYSARAGRMLSSIAAAFLILALAVRIVGGMDVNVAKQGVLVIAAMGAVFAGLIAISRFSGENATKSGIMMLGIAMALLLAVRAMKLVAELSGGEIAKGLAVIAVLELLFAGIIAVSYYAGEHAMKAGAMLLLMSAALLILSGAIAIIGAISGKQLTKALGVIAVLETLFAGLIAVSYLSKDCEGSLKMMAITIAVLVAAVVALTFIEEAKLKSATAALSVVLTAFAMVVAATNFAKDSKGMGKRLLQWLGVVTLLTGVVLLLGHLAPEQALSAAGALSLLLTSFAGSLFILAKSGRVSSTVYTAVWSMLAVVAGLATVIAGLAMLPNPTSLISTTTALSILLTSFAGSLFILAKSGRVSSTVHAPIYTMLAVVAGLAAVLSAMSFLPDVTNLIPTAVALSTLITAMSGAMVLLRFVKPVPPQVLGALATMGGVVAEISTIFAILDWMGVDATVKQAAALSTLLIGMSTACAIVSKVPAAGAAMGALGCAAFIGIMGSVVAGLGALTKIDGFKEMMADGGEQLVQFGYMIGKFTGATLGGTLDGVTMGLPAMGENISDFATALKPFIDTITNIDPEAASGAKLLAETVLILATAGLVDSISALFGGDSSLASFGQQLIPFGYAMVEFSSIVAGNIDSSAVTAAASAGKMLAEMAAAAPNSGGVAGFFAGNNDIDDFGAKLVPFGTAMVRFSSIVAGKIDQKAVEAAAAAGKTMVALADTVPNTGGVVSWFTGNNDLNDFGAMLVPFGTAMVRFSKIVKGKISQDAVDAAKKAGDTMVALADTVPNTGGVVSWFTGNNDLNDFGAKLVPFGSAMVRFSKIVAGNIDQDAVDAAKKAGDTMVALAEKIPNTGGVISWFTGDNDFKKFGKQLVSFGNALIDFSKTVSSVNTGSVSKCADAAYTIVKTARMLTEQKKMDFTILTKGLTAFGESMIDFSDLIAGQLDLEAISTVVNAAKTLAEAANIMPDAVNFEILTNGLTTFGSTMVDFSTTVKDLDTTAIDTATKSGKGIVNMISGIPAELDVSKFAKGVALLGIAIRDFSIMGSESAFDSDGFDALKTAGVNIAAMVQKIPDYIDMNDFVTNLPKLGKAIVDFSNFAGDKGFTLQNALDIASGGVNIAAMVKKIPDYIDMNDFVTNLPKLGKAIVDFAESGGDKGFDLTAVTNLASGGKSIAAMVKKIPDYVDISDFTDALPELGEALTDFISENKDLTTTDAQNIAKVGAIMVNALETVANSAVTTFSSKITTATTDVKKAITTMITTAASHAKNKTNVAAFKSAGASLAEGFATGMSSKSAAVNAAARTLGSNAAAILKKYLKINSPSKVFMKIGESVPEGFAMGIDKLSSDVGLSANGMASTAISNVRGAIARIADFVNNDIDAQPTIRPVLDLSDVRTGANAIGGMLNGSRRLAINAAGIGSISASMAGYQNRGNDDIISSINALRKDINGMPRNNYNINGITYDDGSNITEAVKTLVRAAKIERRT